MITKLSQEHAEKFASLIDEAGVDFTAENVVKCIGFAKQAMLNGECSVETYYHAKQLLLERVEVASELLN